jgi:Rad3-related DNA helicase
MTRALQFFRKGLTPRQSQVEALTKIESNFDSEKHFIGFEGPTGCGKSDVAMAIAMEAKSRGLKTFALTSQRILQDQYQNDFPSPQVELLKGRNAYPCGHPDSNGSDCDKAPCKAKGKAILPECVANRDVRSVVRLEASPFATSCSYWKQVLTVRDADVALFNFSSFLFQQRLKRFGTRDLMVLDEAHGIEDQLLNFTELMLWENDLGLIMMTFDRGLSTAVEVANWIRKNTMLEKIEAQLESLGLAEDVEVIRQSLDREVAKKMHEKELLESLEFKIELFLSVLPKTEWVVEIETRKRRGEMEQVLICRPIYARQFAQDLLFSKASRVLASSATLLDPKVWASNLGLDPAKIGFVQVGCDFPKANRPIKLVPVGSMSWKDKQATLPKLVKWVRDTLLVKHKGERGIIHTHSFDIADAIVAGVGDPRLLPHKRGQDKAEILAQHAERSDSVIVAPAMHEGVDLKDGLSRFAAIVKVPYPSTQDKVVKVRMDEDPDWYSWKTALKIIQSYGRSVRSKDDWAVTYITDSGFQPFAQRASKFFPTWFKEAVTR